MGKYQTVLHEPQISRKRSRVPRAIALVLALVAAPFVYEGGQIILGPWVSMTGAHREPNTPLLNAVSEWSRNSGTEFKHFSDRVFDHDAWNPRTAVPAAIAWAAVMGYVFLRRTH